MPHIPEARRALFLGSLIRISSRLAEGDRGGEFEPRRPRSPPRHHTLRMANGMGPCDRCKGRRGKHRISACRTIFPPYTKAKNPHIPCCCAAVLRSFLFPYFVQGAGEAGREKGRHFRHPAPINAGGFVLYLTL